MRRQWGKSFTNLPNPFIDERNMAALAGADYRPHQLTNEGITCALSIRTCT